MRVKLPALAWFGILYAIIVILALTVSPGSVVLRSLDVNEAIYRMLIFSILIPYALVWGAAFYAYDTLSVYARKIADTREGEGFKCIVLGLKTLAWGLMLETLLNLLLSLIGHWFSGFAAAESIISRYATLIVAGVALVLIQDGTFALVETARARRSKNSIRILIVTSALIGAFFLKLVSDNQGGHANPYYMPIILLILTVVIPYICIWTIGMISIYELRLYSRRVAGVLYKRSLQLVAGGLTIVIVLSIANQYLTAAFAQRSVFSLGPLLIVIYSFLLLEAAGLGLVSLGAKQLKKIEDV